MKPFDTYPEDHARLLKLPHEIQAFDRWNANMDKFRSKAEDLAELVQAILEDEAEAFDQL